MSPSSRAEKTTIDQSVVFAGATPHQVFEALMDEQQHAAFTKGEAQISRHIGGAFSTFDGWANGKNLELIADQKIVQQWRTEDWPAGVLSVCTYVMTPVTTGTELRFTQTGVPKPFIKSIALGWTKFYWKPMQKYFTKKSKPS